MLRWAETNLNIAPNNGAHYNTSSGKYCPEYYGTYAFHLHLHKPSSTGLRVYCYIIKEPQSGSDARLARAYNGGSYSASTTAIVDLEKGDCVYVGNCTRPEDINTLTSYSGTLLDLLD